MARLRLASVITLSTIVVGCGAARTVSGEEDLGEDSGLHIDVGGTGETGEPILNGLELQPSNAVITIDTATTPATPATLTYKAIKHNADGSSADVSTSVSLTIDDPALGSFLGPAFTSRPTLPGGVLGISTIVRGVAEDKSGAANLTIIALRKTGEKKDFFFTVPYMGPPNPDKDVLKFGTNIKQVDVAVTMDTTGSMGGSVENLKSNLSTTIFPALAKAIPSVGLSVSYHDDFPVGGFGSPGCGGGSLPGDVPHGTLQIITTDLKVAQNAANRLEVHCGGDGPESQMASMWHILTGNALTWSGGSVPKHTPKTSHWGGVDFRPGSVPVVVLITDIEWHTETDYAPAGCDGGTIAKLTDAFKTRNARFVDITSTYADESQANALSDATKSAVPASAMGSTCGAGQCPTGASGACRPAGPGGTCRLNFLHSGGTGVSTSIVKAIQALSVGSQFNVTAVPSNDETNAVGEDGKVVDATLFIKALRAMEEGDTANGCPPKTAVDTDSDGVKDTFQAVVVGTPVCFEVLPKMNTTVKPKPQAQFYNAFIDVLGMPGSVKLDKRTVLFLVPPRDIAAK